MTGDSESRPLSAAIVGCGIIGKNHARAILRHPRLELMAVIDTNISAAQGVAEMVAELRGGNPPRVASSLAEALEQGPFDLVAICTPSGMHADLALQAAASGANVVIEKPIDVSVAQARRLVSAAEEARRGGRVISVISQHRFDPASIVVAQAAQRGELGQLTSATASVAWWRTQQYYDSGDWRGTWDLDGGGAAMNQGVHTVDLLVWLLGQPVEISAETALLAHDRVAIEDVAVAIIRFASGALATFHATTAAFPGLTVRIQLHGTRGSAIIDDDRLAYFSSLETDEGAQHGASAHNQARELVPADELAGAARGPGAFTLGHLRQYADVVDAIESGREPGVRVEDALLSLAVVRGIYISATLGTKVTVADVLAGRFDEVIVRTGHGGTTTETS